MKELQLIECELHQFELQQAKNTFYNLTQHNKMKSSHSQNERTMKVLRLVNRLHCLQPLPLFK